MLDKVLNKIVSRLRHLQLQIRIGNAEERRNHNGMTCALGSFQKRPKRANCSFRPLQDHLQPATQKTPLLSLRR